ncbi:hypothetical protein EXE44_04730 [Halorubrum sp. SS7]|uniref:hypothetical protein n=1 Tax=unclassified Halorubrum TaxID=2642239 RepID=UPI0010F975CB|nr:MULTISPECIES: hypothetical protein [unclassified Halorubrum]TKX52700.1 hypothetical protein EXE42_15680 [Halorubrum sp. SP3]TKX58851.1 hypothetical protein EXE44_04730 [Halorubrum sp. SS7]
MSDETVTTHRDETLTVTERPPSIPEDIHAITDEHLHALVRQVAKASYRAARYRGQMRADALDPTKQKVIERKAEEWLDQHKDEYC